MAAKSGADLFTECSSLPDLQNPGGGAAIGGREIVAVGEKQRRRLPPATAGFDRRVGPTPGSDDLVFGAKSFVSSSSSKPCSHIQFLTSLRHLPGQKTVAAVGGLWPDFVVVSGDHGWFRQLGFTTQSFPNHRGVMGGSGGGSTVAQRRHNGGGRGSSLLEREREVLERERALENI